MLGVAVMLVMLLMTLTALASDAPFEWAKPPAPSPVPSECQAAIDLVVGKPIPAGLIDGEGNVTCYGTLVPTSQLAGLILTGSWAARAVPRGRQSDLELEWQLERYTRLDEAFSQPTPPLQRPAVQRNLGRAEAVALFILAVGTVALLDSEVIR